MCVRLGRCNEVNRGSQSTAYLDHIISSAASKQRAGLSAAVRLWIGRKERRGLVLSMNGTVFFSTESRLTIGSIQPPI